MAFSMQRNLVTVRSSLLTWVISGLLVATLAIGFPGLAKARAASMSSSQTSTEERFQDLFVTAGYCTAFGAALGTAFLAFTSNPAENLRFVAMGASLGFIGGSALGSYVVLSPLLTSEGADAYSGSLASEGRLPSHGLVLRPTFDRASHRLRSIEGGLTLARF
jgi:hypothetical protein